MKDRCTTPSGGPSAHNPEASASLLTYVHESWAFLRRSPLDPAPDPKIDNGRVSYLYVARGENIEEIRRCVEERTQHRALFGQKPDDEPPVVVCPLPEDKIPNDEHGLLYLPHDYVVSGGRFNEMYGWDSYWIIRGLLDDGQLELARGMLENLYYEIDHYGGKILNANRTYYLERSQPPLLGIIIAEVAFILGADERAAFLEKAVHYLEKECLFWERERYIEETGLFRYGHPAMGELGLCPEVVIGEIDPETGFNHYDKIIASFRQLPGDNLLRHRFYNAETDSLTPDAIAGDRGIRESGFDPSMYMGAFGFETLDYNPVCLNTLLYIQLQHLAAFYDTLGDSPKSKHWVAKAHKLAARIQDLLWDEEKGSYFCYNHRTGLRSTFPFLTTVYPLFAHLATSEQADKVRQNVCAAFETDFGLMTTPEQTGCQWDAPHMWPPLVDFTIQGFLNYGFTEDAHRIARKFLQTVQRAYDETGAVFEKYNAQTGTHDTDNVKFGYKVNVIGFGWTNALIGRVNALIGQ